MTTLVSITIFQEPTGKSLQTTNDELISNINKEKVRRNKVKINSRTAERSYINTAQKQYIHSITCNSIHDLIGPQEYFL